MAAEQDRVAELERQTGQQREATPRKIEAVQQRTRELERKIRQAQLEYEADVAEKAQRTGDDVEVPPGHTSAQYNGTQ